MPNERTQAIAGVVPPNVEEAVIMQVWPSISAFGLGRVLGGLYQLPLLLRIPVVLATLPVALGLYAIARFPNWRRYTITTRRVLIQRGLRPRALEDVALEEVDDVRVVEQVGQKFFRAGDLELLNQGRVVLRLPGVQHPEVVRRNILAARHAYVKVMAAHRATNAVVAAATA